MFWNNLGDVFASLIETKYVQSGREDFCTVENVHTDNQQFFWSMYNHIISELSQQENIIEFFNTHSKPFLICLLEIIKYAAKLFKHNNILTGRKLAN